MALADRLFAQRCVMYAASLLLTLSAVSARADSQPLPPKWQQLVGMFDKTLAKNGIVGGSVALVENGRIVARHHYGYADREQQRKVDNDTIFHWASITKTLNGIAMMQLRDRGLLTLDDPVTRWVPELRLMHNEYGSMDAITIRMLLNHSAGFQAPTWPYKEGAPWEPFEPTRWEQLVAMMPYQKVDFAPGTKFSYSNPAWIYAARILESLTGDQWQYYVHKNIFMPLGMSRSYVSYTPEYLKPHRSNRYIVETGKDGKQQAVDYGPEFNPGITIPNGGWNSPLDDVAAYIAFLTDATGGDRDKQARFAAVLRRSSLEEMWQPQLPLENGHGHIGYAFFLLDDVAPGIVGHTGGQGGFSSFFYINRQTGRGIIGAYNTAGEGDSFSILHKAGVEVLR
ncbi:MAG TPA: serine hydrolase domain-containing protein [Steroidobacteraceae bacterium]|nr:serine hydrolase domain-containing protein [Steroidobacteraceae bacterium]